MEKLLYQEYSDRERLEMLESNADGVEEMDYTEYLSPEEFLENKTLFAQKSIEESKILDRKKEVNSSIKEELKPIVKDKLKLLTEIKHGSRSLHGRCFKLIDYANHEVGYYNPWGQLVYSRPAKPEESQRTLMSVKRTGTHN